MVKLSTRMVSAILTGAGHLAGMLVCDGRTGSALVRRGLAVAQFRYGKPDYRAPVLTPAGQELLIKLKAEHCR